MDDLIGSTNRLARIQQGGPAQLSLQAQVEAAAELCLHYRGLLLNPSFRRDIEQALKSGNAPLQRLQKREVEELRCHTNEAVALLVEAGVDGQHALDAVRSVEEVLRLPTAAPLLPPAEFFQRLATAKEAVCSMRNELGLREQRESGNYSLRKAGLAGVGLALVGVTASALVVIAGPAAAAGGAVIAGVGAVAGAIGATIFQHNTTGLKRP